MAKSMIGALRGGGTWYIDLDTFADNPLCSPDFWLNPKHFEHIHDREKFLEYD